MDVVSLLKSLLTHSATTPHEHNAALHITHLLQTQGWTVTLHDVAPQRQNILATRGEIVNVQVVLNTHIDTVPPWINQSEDQHNIYGRGSCDAKGSMAAMITAANQLINSKSIDAAKLALLFTVGEEVDHAGMKQANSIKGLKPKYLIVGEPTESKLAVGHKGCLRFTIKATGKACHSGYPEQGSSAIEKLIKVVYKIQTQEWPVSERLGATTFNCGEISGGAAANILAPFAEASYMARLSVHPDQVLPVLKRIIADVPDVTLDVEGCFDPIHCKTVTGYPTDVMKYFTDIGAWALGGETLLFGPGSIRVAHSDDEFISKSELIASVETYGNIIKQLIDETES